MAAQCAVESDRMPASFRQVQFADQIILEICAARAGQLDCRAHSIRFFQRKTSACRRLSIESRVAFLDFP